jgi:hypothetical protein
MLEIYNEIVRDLLDPKGATKKGGLKVRQHPKRGFYGELSEKLFTFEKIVYGSKLMIFSIFS